MELSAGSACYGNGEIVSELRPDADDFNSAGQVIDLGQVRTLTTRADSNDVLIMTPRLNLVDEPATLVMFGDGRLENLSDANGDFVPLNVTIARQEGANIRAQPNSESGILEARSWGEMLTAIARTEDSAWIQVIVSGTSGWVASELLAEQDFSVLPVNNTDENLSGGIYGAMQNIRYYSEPVSEFCVGAPPSGLLLQSPADTDAIIIINDLGLLFNGTLYVQANLEDGMTISILEGYINLLDDVFAADAGDRFTVELDETAQAVNMPDFVEAYNFSYANAAPLELLPREFELVFNVEGLLTPFEPGTGYLTSMALDDPCTIGWAGEVNLRAGPGTEYPIQQGVGANFAANPIARAVSTTNEVWWKIAEDVWVLASITVFAGNCGDLPFVEAPPLD